VGFIAKILSSVRTLKRGHKNVDVKVDGHGGANVTADLFLPPGYDALPMDGDFAVQVKGERAGQAATVGTIDQTVKKSAKGEGRLYSRNAAGVLKAEVWLKADGTITGNNANGSFVLQAGGAFVVNGVTIATDGTITGVKSLTATDQVTAAGVTMTGHKHPYTDNGVPMNTGVGAG